MSFKDIMEYTQEEYQMAMDEEPEEKCGCGGYLKPTEAEGILICVECGATYS